MPKEVFGRGYRFMDRKELLTFEEIERLARAFVAHGVEKIRITAASRCCDATSSSWSRGWRRSTGST